jgi:RNA recognition motif 2
MFNFTSIQPLFLSKSEFDALLNSDAGSHEKTTVMLRKVPRKLAHPGLVRIINSLVSKKLEHHQMTDITDLVYLPLDVERNCNRGYAFINFVNEEFAKIFMEETQNEETLRLHKLSGCSSVYAHVQGKQETLNKISKTSSIDHCKY